MTTEPVPGSELVFAVTQGSANPGLYAASRFGLEPGFRIPPGSVGTTLNGENPEGLATFATGVLNRLSPGENNAPPADTLPGIKPGPNGAIATLAKALAKRGATHTARTTEKNKATATLEQITAKVETLAAHRKEIQLAADQAWPWRKDGVEAIRKAFLLPVDRPLSD